MREYVGGYADWLRQGGRWPTEAEIAAASEPEKVETEVAVAVVEPVKPKAQKLSYKLQRELDGLPKKIELLEAELELLQKEMAAPDFFSQGDERTAPVLKKLEETELSLEHCYERWTELEGE